MSFGSFPTRRNLFPWLGVLGIALFIAAGSASADEFTSANYRSLNPVMSAGGYGASASFKLYGEISGTAVGTSSSASFTETAGFFAFPYATTPVVSATVGNAQVALSWTASQGFLGWNPTNYTVGEAAVSGGPYAYTSPTSSLSSTITGLTNGTVYYFIVRVLDGVGNVIATSTQVSATPASSGGGGGGGGSITTVGGGSVVLSGRAYPGSSVTVLKDAQVAAITTADSKANFQVMISGLSTGDYIFSLYSEDTAGNRSSMVSFPTAVTSGNTTTVGGIFIAPTIDVDKSEVKQGDNIAIFGQSYPGSAVTIAVHSDAGLFFKTPTDGVGAYLFNLDSSVLDLGSHLAQAKSVFVNEISSSGASVSFLVGDENISKLKQQKLIGDLNNNGRVNLIDFSMMLYWYRRPLSGAGFKADLNGDGAVDLRDVSILVSHWTG
ncbi:MAG: Cellulose 1,4-beta-cellobiosidase-like protein [Parcubacteria group bacterium GW2011_GWB1_57_6]|nr:MAG: Cellulose 1,4-beta-cellobiosidase-like protein [Parcubacteria group bacterium GW2011_GWA1_56_13]KKW46146.1 MAG: Cellulose 1,4-beta-cellobiosidase-like protein [Parcubacteria group bacterium GW2011_GWB1_57_6]